MNMKRTDRGKDSGWKVQVCACVWEVCMGMCSVTVEKEKLNRQLQRLLIPKNYKKSAAVGIFFFN